MRCTAAWSAPAPPRASRRCWSRPARARNKDRATRLFRDKSGQGADAETLAQRHLERRGLKLVTRNWRCSGGELDLVMRKPDTLVLVEVRKRSRGDYGGAFASVTAAKRRRLVFAAKMFLAQHPQYAGDAVRFDVVAVDGDDKVEWLEAAFDATDEKTVRK